MTNGINADIRELLALRYTATKIKFFNQQKVSTTQSGSNLSMSHGRGMDFEEVRPYQNGDDTRLIHWSLTARLGKPFTKIYREEHERAVYFIVDQSLSMQFGTRVCFKHVLAAKITAIIGWSALQNNEQVGGVVFNDTASEFIKPKKSRQSLLGLFNILTSNQKLRHNQGGLEYTLQFISQKAKYGSIIIIISDYFTLNENIQTYLRLLSRKCAVVNLFAYDQLETQLPKLGTFTFTGTNNTQLTINSNKKNNQLYATPFTTRLELINSVSQQNNMHFLQLATNDDLVAKVNHRIMQHGTKLL